MQAQKAKMSILCWFYRYFLNSMQQFLAAKNKAKSKTSKKWKNLIFAHADFDHTSNEIRRGRKFVGSKIEKTSKKKQICAVALHGNVMSEDRQEFDRIVSNAVRTRWRGVGER